MLLIYRGPGLEHWPLVVGQTYDVAEIYEVPYHLMVRRPGEKRWPVPGDLMFGWHPELFEPTTTPIEICSCGYEYVDLLCDKLGVVMSEPEVVEWCRTFQRATSCDDVSSWSGDPAELHRMHEIFDQAYEELPLGSPDMYVCDDLFFPEDEIACPFAALYHSTQTLLHCDVKRTEASEMLRRFLALAGLPPKEPQILQVTYFRGNGQPRLINPPSE